jgi:DNA-binding MarR family transcriptional regulator
VKDKTVERIEREVAVLVRLAELARADKQASDRLVRSAYLLLTALDETGPMTTAALGANMGVDVSTVSRQVAPLEEQGLVSRVPNPADGRSTTIAITPLGASRLLAARAERYRIYSELLSGWSEEDRDRLASYLHRLNAAIADREKKRPA